MHRKWQLGWLALALAVALQATGCMAVTAQQTGPRAVPRGDLLLTGKLAAMVSTMVEGTVAMKADVENSKRILDEVRKVPEPYVQLGLSTTYLETEYRSYGLIMQVIAFAQEVDTARFTEAAAASPGNMPSSWPVASVWATR